MLKKTLITTALMTVLAVLASPVACAQGTPGGEAPEGEEKVMTEEPIERIFIQLEDDAKTQRTTVSYVDAGGDKVDLPRIHRNSWFDLQVTGPGSERVQEVILEDFRSLETSNWRVVNRWEDVRFALNVEGDGPIRGILEGSDPGDDSRIILCKMTLVLDTGALLEIDPPWIEYGP